jgi:HlyD family secretion protein
MSHRENVLKIPNAALRFRPDFVKREAAPSQGSPVAGSASASAVSSEQVLDRLKTRLNLTPAQQASLALILKDAQGEIQTARKAGGPEQGKAKAKELRGTNRMKIRSLLTEEQKKIYDQMGQGGTPGQVSGPVYKVWTPVPKGQPVPVEIVTGISDGSFTEMVSGGLREGQQVITETMGGNNKGSGRQSTGPSMRGFR